MKYIYGEIFFDVACVMLDVNVCVSSALVTMFVKCVDVSSKHEKFLTSATFSINYGFVPTPEDYACMIDLLGHAGHIEKRQSKL